MRKVNFNFNLNLPTKDDIKNLVEKSPVKLAIDEEVKDKARMTKDVLGAKLDILLSDLSKKIDPDS